MNSQRRGRFSAAAQSISVASSASVFELLTSFDTGREGRALVFRQSLCDTFLDCLVLSPQ